MYVSTCITFFLTLANKKIFLEKFVYWYNSMYFSWYQCNLYVIDPYGEKYIIINAPKTYYNDNNARHPTILPKYHPFTYLYNFTTNLR